MPRIDRGEDAPEKEYFKAAEYRQVRYFHFGVAAFFLLLILMVLFIPMFYGKTTGAYSLVLGFDEINLASSIMGIIYSIALGVFAVLFLVWGSSKNFDKTEKRAFFTYLVSSCLNLAFAIAFGIAGDILVMLAAALLAGLNLLVLYLDFKLFHDL